MCKYEREVDGVETVAEEMTLRPFKFDSLTRIFTRIDDRDALGDRATNFRPTKVDDSAETDILQIRVRTLKSQTSKCKKV